MLMSLPARWQIRQYFPCDLLVKGLLALEFPVCELPRLNPLDLKVNGLVLPQELLPFPMAFRQGVSSMTCEARDLVA